MTISPQQPGDHSDSSSAGSAKGSAEGSVCDRVKAGHTAIFGSEPTLVASAPTTWSLLGEHVDVVGGIVLVASSDLRVGIAASPRSDNNISVSVNGAKPNHIAMGDVSDFAFSVLDARDKTESVPSPHGSWPERLGGVVWSLIFRQLLPRDTPGFNIAVESEAPVDWGLGVHAAAEVAFASALVVDDENRGDYPLRVRVAEACFQSAAIFSATHALRARYTAALRSMDGQISVVDYKDESVTHTPHIASRNTVVFAVNTPHNPGGQIPEEMARRLDFIDKATRAFGVESLRHLPDAAPRVRDWLEAVHKVHGPSGVPSLQEATRWLEFFEAETRRAQSMVPLLRSRNVAELSDIVAASQRALNDDYSVSGTDSALAQLCRSRGAVTARSAHAGVSNAVIAVVEATHARNFAADLVDDGLEVIELRPGTAA